MNWEAFLWDEHYTLFFFLSFLSPISMQVNSERKIFALLATIFSLGINFFYARFRRQLKRTENNNCFSIVII